MKMRKPRFGKVSVVIGLLGFLLMKASASQAFAATLYWVGANDADASVASNWSTTNPSTCSTGVTPSGAAPGSADQLNLDADYETHASIDRSFGSTVSSVLLNAGYVGRVT